MEICAGKLLFLSGSLGKAVNANVKPFGIKQLQSKFSLRLLGKIVKSNLTFAVSR